MLELCQYSSDAQNADEDNLEWFVGFVQSGGENYTFACVVRGTKGMGADARGVVRSILQQEHLL